MHYLCQVVITANILGSFNDPFEFQGNYGKDINPIRDYVFERVVSREALVNQWEYPQITQAIQADVQHGPTLAELIPDTLIEKLITKQKELKIAAFHESDLKTIISFIKKYGHKKIFYFLRNNPHELLSLDKALRDQAAREGHALNLPILSSTEPLVGDDAMDLKVNLMDALFTPQVFNSVKAEHLMRKNIDTIASNFLEPYLGKDANTSDLLAFTTPAGQVFFYWLYQALNLHLVATDQRMISQINTVKSIFAQNLGNPHIRAELFKDKVIAFDVSVIFTQESDAIVPQVLSEGGLFHSIKSQNPLDGTFIFLRGDSWEPNYEVVTIDDYDGFARGRINAILAQKKGSGEKFLLASAHGNSTRSEDGRLQITKVMEKFRQLAQLPGNEGLQLVIGMDANTKSEEDVRLLRTHLDALGLVATSVGPTTIKRRMVTTQHSKAGKMAIDEEDYIITLKQDQGGVYALSHPIVGFRETCSDPQVELPNVENPSDHYPVGVTLEPLES